MTVNDVRDGVIAALEATFPTAEVVDGMIEGDSFYEGE